MKFISLAFLSIIMVCIISCDPMRRINMVNKSNGDAAVIWVIKEDSINNSPFYMTNTDSVVVLLKAGQPYKEAKMSFGSGTWSTAQLSNVVDDLKSMEIRAASGNIKLDSTKDILSFLMLRKSGIDKSKIKIIIR